MGSSSSSSQEAKQQFEAQFEAFQKAAAGIVTPPVYKPPQLNPTDLAWSCGLVKINAIGHRATICSAPSFPCCCAQATVSLAAPACHIDVFRMSDPDVAFKKLLSYCHPNCPDMFKGVWVMQDNIDTNMIVTLQDADWSSARSGLKDSHYNWSSDYGTCYGAVGIVFSKGKLQIEISEDGKWVSFLEPGYKNPQWAYVMQPGDVLKGQDGEMVSCEPGDMVRMNFLSAYNPKSFNYYQYRLRRIAYYDDAGALIKTKAYDEYVKAASAPTPHQGCCCNYCLCNLTYQEVAENMNAVSDEVSVIYYPTAPQA